MPSRPLRCVLILFAVVATADAAADDISTAVTRCVRIVEADACLQCYDTSVAPLASRGAAALPVAPAATITVAPVASAEQRFGTPPKEQRERAAAAAAEPREISSTVTAVHESAERLLRFDLANGQVWRQVTEEHLLIKVGEPVTISKAMFGSYLLATSGGSSTRVKRIR